MLVAVNNTTACLKPFRNESDSKNIKKEKHLNKYWGKISRERWFKKLSTFNGFYHVVF